MTPQGLLYLIAIILLVIAALPLNTRGVSLACLAAAFALLAYAWTVVTDA